MSDQPLPPDNCPAQEGTSQNGNPYQFDKEEPIAKAKGEDNPVSVEKEPASVNVCWPVTTDWVDAGEEVRRKVGITRYKLLYHPRPPPMPGQRRPRRPEYSLWFTNTVHYDYVFWDRTPDGYTNMTFQNSDHWIGYDSQDPTIVMITVRHRENAGRP